MLSAFVAAGGGGTGGGSMTQSIGMSTTSDALKKLRQHANAREGPLSPSAQTGELSPSRRRLGEPHGETLRGGVMADLMDNVSVNSAATERARARREESEYWQRLSEVVSDRTVRVWKVSACLSCLLRSLSFSPTSPLTGAREGDGQLQQCSAGAYLSGG